MQFYRRTAVGFGLTPLISRLPLEINNLQLYLFKIQNGHQMFLSPARAPDLTKGHPTWSRCSQWCSFRKLAHGVIQEYTIHYSFASYWGECKPRSERDDDMLHLLAPKGTCLWCSSKIKDLCFENPSPVRIYVMLKMRITLLALKSKLSFLVCDIDALDCWIHEPITVIRKYWIHFFHQTEILSLLWILRKFWENVFEELKLD